jgi:thioredoxin-related protein
MIGFIYHRKQEKVNYVNELSDSKLNVNKFVNMDSITFSQNTLIQNQYTLLVLFDSECEGCKIEIEMLKRDRLRLQDYNLILVSTQKIADIKSFIEKENLKEYSNMYFAKTEISVLSKYIKVISYPSILIYDKKNTFVKGFRGSTETEEILKFIQN